MTIRRPSKLLKFLERVSNAAAPRGKQTELADFIGTTRQQVNRWLNGVKMPGGEVTLLMLEWVTAEEDKQTKTGGVLRTPRQRRPKQPQSSYEKRKLKPKGR